MDRKGIESPKRLNDYTPDEFYAYCKDDRITDVEIYNYIEHITGFDQVKLNLFFTDFCNYFWAQSMIIGGQEAKGVEYRQGKECAEAYRRKTEQIIDSYLEGGETEEFGKMFRGDLGGLMKVHNVFLSLLKQKIELPAHEETEEDNDESPKRIFNLDPLGRDATRYLFDRLIGHGIIKEMNSYTDFSNRLADLTEYSAEQIRKNRNKELSQKAKDDLKERLLKIINNL